MLPFVAVKEQRVVTGVQENEEDLDHVFAGDSIAGFLVRRKWDLVVLDPIRFHESNVCGWVFLADERTIERKLGGLQRDVFSTYTIVLNLYSCRVLKWAAVG
jgi:hypothetical protein